MKKVEIVILNYNGWEDTIECLNSLQSTISNTNYIINVLIVDNGSDNDSVIELQKWMENSYIEHSTIHSINEKSQKEKIILLSLNTNYGFAGGCNRGIEYSLNSLKADYVMLLNNDTVVEEGFIEPLITKIENDETIGIISSEIHEYFDRQTFFLGGAISYSRCSGYHNYNSRELNMRNVTFLSGCLWLIRGEAIKTCGLLDEKYFLYIEDVDYCYRMAESGYRLTCTKESVIYHKESRSTKSKPIISYYNTRNRLYFCKKIKRKKLKKAFFYFYFFFSRIIKCILMPQNTKYIYLGVKDYINGRMGNYYAN